MAKASLGAFPPIAIAPRNAKLKRAVDFSRASRICFHAAIYKCFNDFNRTNGTVVTLQNGHEMNMAKAIILAIFCDHPAGRKCCLCGSACPQCFCSKPDFAKKPIVGTMVLRTPRDVAAKKQVYFLISFLMSVLIIDVMYVLMNDLMYVLINDLMYVMNNNLMCVFD